MQFNFSSMHKPAYNERFSIFPFVVVFSGILCFSVFAFFQTAYAGTNRWISQGSGPGTTSVFAVAVDQQTPTTLYAGVTYGIYKSTNSGGTWINTTNNMLTDYGDIPKVNTIAIHPINSSILYVGSISGGGVFKSTDGGQSWTPANNGMTTCDVSVLVINPQDPAILFAGTIGYDSRGGIIKSRNGGTSWKEANEGLPIPANVTSIVIDPTDSNIIFAGLYGEGLYKSIDGGETWTAHNIGVLIKYNRVLAIDPNMPTTLYLGTVYGDIYKSVNGGVTFQGLSLDYKNMRSITTIWIADSSTIFVGTEDGGVYKSTDAGENWVYSSFGAQSSYIQSFTGVEGDPNVYYIGTSGGVFQSRDEGTTWSERKRGLPAGRTEKLLLLPQPLRRLNAGTSGGGVHAFQDGYWDFSSAEITNTSWIRSLAYDPVTPTTLYAGTFFGHLYKSTDGGSTWTDKSTGLPLTGGDIREIVVHPITPTIVYAGIAAGRYDSGVYKSEDGGNYWVKSSNGIPYENENISALMIDRKNPEILYAGVHGQGMYKTTNGSETWSAINNGLTNFYILGIAIDPNQSSILYVGSEGMLFRSIDSGASWQTTNLNWTVRSIVFNSASVGTLYAGTEGLGVYMSADYGLRWEPITLEGLPGSGGPVGDVYIYDLELDPDKQILYAATYGVYALCLTGECKDIYPVNIFLPVVNR